MTKVILKSLLIASISSIVFTGCWWDKEPEVKNLHIDSELQGAPNWVMIPKVKGYISELGGAPKNAGNDFSFQREEAMANARNNIAKQITIKVDNMFKTFKATTGHGDNATMDRAIETVSKQVSSQSLSGTSVKDTWISKSGTLYVLMVIDAKSVIQLMEKSIKTSFKNDDAMYQKFLSSKAQGELEQELEKLDE